MYRIWFCRRFFPDEVEAFMNTSNSEAKKDEQNGEVDYSGLSHLFQGD